MKRSYLFLAIFTAALAITLSMPGCDTLITENNETTLFDPTLGQACIVCHTDANDAIIVVPTGQLEESAHYEIDLLEATINLNGTLFNTAECGPVCHSANGFVKFVENGSQDPVDQPSRISCNTCHMPHTGDYGTYQLPPLRGDDTLGIVLNSNRVYDLGSSNMCVHCHQANPKPIIAASVTLTPDFGPHNSPQADMLIGAGGLVVDSGDVTESHASIQDGCLSCHFGTGVGYSFGEHTFRLENESSGVQFIDNCTNTGCHPTTTNFNVNTKLDTIATLADSLQTLLLALNVLDSTDPLGVRFNAGMIVPSGAGTMLHSYLLHKLDGSGGVHNAKFSTALLEQSITQFDSVSIAQFAVVDSSVLSLLCLNGNTNVQFVDQSLGNTINWEYDYGDGSPTQKFDTLNPPTPSHTFDTAGTYTVTLTTFGLDSVQSVESKVDYLTVTDTVIANFVSDITTGMVPLTVTFTDSTSGGPSVWAWDFGDGFTDSIQNPVHIFADTGSFVVSLTVTNICNTNTLINTDTIIVDP